MTRSSAHGTFLVLAVLGLGCGTESIGVVNSSSGDASIDAGRDGSKASGSGGVPIIGGIGGGMPEVSSEGDGERTIGPDYAADPLTHVNMAVPQNRSFSFTMSGAQSAIYRGIRGNFTRNVTVHIPMQYDPAHPAALMVTQDAQGADYLPAVIDNLLASKEVPVIVSVLIGNGGGDSVGSERGLEYDTVSGLYAEFVMMEVLPRAVAEAKMRLNIDLRITADPNGHATMGGSSGGAAAFSMLWWHPDLFRRMIGWSPTLVTQVPAGSPFPHGCWVYHDIDPYNSSAPNGLVVADCEPAAGFLGDSAPTACDTALSRSKCEAVAECDWNTKRNRPIRVWHQSSTKDLGTDGGPETYRNYDLANQRLAAALKKRGYHYHYDHAQGAYHNDARVQTATVVEAMRWLWRGYALPQ
jgi:iron(III)-enterobactin esterase